MTKTEIANQITIPLAVGTFEARGVELFYRRHNAQYGHLVAIYPTESWAARVASKLNEHIDADSQALALGVEKVVCRIFE